MPIMEERTVPAWVAQLALGDLTEDVSAALRAAGRTLGSRVELDVAAVGATLGNAAASKLVAYEQRCRDFFEAWLAGEAAGPYVIVRRPLVKVRQIDTKDARVDLGPTLDALTTVSGIGDIVEEVTGAKPDWELVARLGTAFEAAVERDGNDTTVTLHCAFDTSWPDELGGVPTRGELQRILRLGLSHAAWRDRRNRRLVSVTVEAEEIWPDPERAETVVVL